MSAGPGLGGCVGAAHRVVSDAITGKGLVLMRVGVRHFIGVGGTIFAIVLFDIRCNDGGGNGDETRSRIRLTDDAADHERGGERGDGDPDEGEEKQKSNGNTKSVGGLASLRRLRHGTLLHGCSIGRGGVTMRGNCRGGWAGAEGEGVGRSRGFILGRESGVKVEMKEECALRWHQPGLGLETPRADPSPACMSGECDHRYQPSCVLRRQWFGDHELEL